MITNLQRVIIEEVTRRSGLQINTDKSLFANMCGFTAFFAPGCYVVKQPGIERDILHFTPDNHLERADEILFHELTHATGVHLGRNMKADYNVKNYNFEEVIAETSALKLLIHFDMATDKIIEDCQKYIARYSTNLTDYEISDAQAKAEEAKNFLLEKWLPDFNAAYVDYHERKTV